MIRPLLANPLPTKAAPRRFGVRAQKKSSRLELSIALPRGMSAASARKLVRTSLKMTPERVLRTVIEDAVPFASHLKWR